MTYDEVLEAIARDADRVVIVGGPLTGKSRLAFRADPAGLRTRCTDDLVGVLEWSEASAEVARWLEEPGPWIVEGVATVRALRKWLAAHPGERFDAVVLLMAQPFGDRTKGQVAMSKGVATIWNEIAPLLLQRGARVLKHDGIPDPPRPAPGLPAAAAPADQSPAP